MFGYPTLPLDHVTNTFFLHLCLCKEVQIVNFKNKQNQEKEISITVHCNILMCTWSYTDKTKQTCSNLKKKMKPVSWTSTFLLCNDLSNEPNINSFCQKLLVLSLGFSPKNGRMLHWLDKLHCQSPGIVGRLTYVYHLTLL